MTTLTERLAKGPTQHRRPGKVDAILESLEADERALLEDALANRRHTAEALAAILTETGHPVSASTIRTYRRSLQREVH